MSQQTVTRAERALEALDNLDAEVARVRVLIAQALGPGPVEPFGLNAQDVRGRLEEVIVQSWQRSGGP